MALNDSAVEVSAANAPWIGVCFGTSIGKGELFEHDYPAFLERGVRGIHPLTLPQFASHGLSSQVAIELGVSGICSSIATGCTVGLDAIQWSHMQICQGRAKMMVVGSAEALINPFTFGAICATGVLSKRNARPEQASRPFDLERDGLVMSEGAGAIVLEALDHAEERQALIYAEVLGAATARDGNDLVHCDVNGAGTARVMEIALYQSQLPKSCIDYICAHGVGLRDYDTAETCAIKSVFGKHAYHIPVSSIKSMIGQPFAAGGSLQVVASCLTLQHSCVPPTINYQTLDPTCDLDYVPQRARAARVRALLVHAHGMGGTDSALVLGKLDAGLE
jgi:3-oxoacyl-(acyl-carrier-protein) synthase